MTPADQLAADGLPCVAGILPESFEVMPFNESSGNVQSPRKLVDSMWCPDGGGAEPFDDDFQGRGTGQHLLSR
jgi:hypothetical protein